MPLSFSRAQIDSTGRSAFQRRLIELIRRDYPEQAQELDDVTLGAELWRQAERAGQYGLRDERSAATFVLAAWLLGVDFDRRIPALAQVLAEPSLSPAEKAKALEDFSIALFATLEEGRRSDGGA